MIHYICPTGRWDAESNPPRFRPDAATACGLAVVRPDRRTPDGRYVTCPTCVRWLAEAKARVDAHLDAEPGRRAALLAELEAGPWDGL